MSEILLSVCLITYNHHSFIEQAIESVLMQKVNFAWEFIIADDFSTDGTREIVKDYATKYPERIKLILQEKNVGAAQNWVDLITKPVGKYIAYFEGDDYWIDPLKLQKQIDFLEANSDFAFCFHRVEIVSDESKKSFLSNPNQKEETTFEDLSFGFRIPTLSCVFRNNLFDKLPDWLLKSPVGDYPYFLLHAQHGKIKFLQDVMGVYRLHGGGVWSLKTGKHQNEIFLTTLALCYEHFYPLGASGFESQISEVLSSLSFQCFDEQNYQEFRFYFNKLIKRRKHIKLRTKVALYIRFIISYQNNLAKFYKNIREYLKA